MNVLISGTRGEGKSTLALFLARQWGPTVVFFDPKGNVSAGIVVYSPDDLLEHLEKEDYILKDGYTTLPLIYRADKPHEEAFTEMAEALFPRRFEGYKGKIAVIVDEANELQSPHTIVPQLRRIVAQAPADKVMVIQATHSISEWNNKCRSTMDELFLFRQIGPRNYTLVQEYCGTEVADIVCDESFPQHHCVQFFFGRRDGKQFIVRDKPEEWFAPLTSNEEPTENEPYRQSE